jgi:ABC-type Zn uptake system ZnuABC Zn-binding protein ZnuA
MIIEQNFQREIVMKYLMLLAVVACASKNPGQLSQKAKDLEVYATKPTTCQVVGKIVGTDENGSTELATNNALNQAAEMGASGIFVNQEVPNGKARAVHATAYNCN